MRERAARGEERGLGREGGWWWGRRRGEDHGTPRSTPGTPTICGLVEGPVAVTRDEVTLSINTAPRWLARNSTDGQIPAVHPPLVRSMRFDTASSTPPDVLRADVSLGGPQNTCTQKKPLA